MVNNPVIKIKRTQIVACVYAVSDSLDWCYLIVYFHETVLCYNHISS